MVHHATDSNRTIRVECLRCHHTCQIFKCRFAVGQLSVNCWYTAGRQYTDRLLGELFFTFTRCCSLQFLPGSAIEHSSFLFLYSTCRFDIVCFTIQLCCCEHSSLRNSTFNFRKYPTASQSMTVSVGSTNYQNTPLVGASKGRSLHPRQ